MRIVRNEATHNGVSLSNDVRVGDEQAKAETEERNPK